MAGPVKAVGKDGNPVTAAYVDILGHQVRGGGGGRAWALLMPHVSE